MIHQQETEKLLSEITGKSISIVFDGTTHVCEAMVIIIRYVDDYWCTKRVAKIMLLAKALSGEVVARELMVCISTELGISVNRLVAAMHDRAAVINVAMQTVKILYPTFIDIGHTLHRVSKKFYTPVLDEFSKCGLAYLLQVLRLN